MAAKKPTTPFDITDRLLAAYETNNRINEYLIRNLPGAAWDAAPPAGKGRSIAAIVAHIHNVRLMWLKAVGSAMPLPEKLEPGKVAQDEALSSLNKSCNAMLPILG